MRGVKEYLEFFTYQLEYNEDIDYIEGPKLFFCINEFGLNKPEGLVFKSGNGEIFVVNTDK